MVSGRFYAKRAFSTVLASFQRNGDRLELWLLTGCSQRTACSSRIKDVPFLPAVLDVKIIETGPGRATIDIRADRYADFVHVPTPAPGVRFSDNYLDLRAGETREIEMRGLTADVPASSLRALPYAGVSEGS